MSPILLFQSTPAFSGEGTIIADEDGVHKTVSIHPRLFRRGNSTGKYSATFMIPFQSTPAFSGEGTELRARL